MSHSMTAIVFAGGAARAARKARTHRPDYLLISPDPTERYHYRIRALECKGTKTPSYSVNQIARALRQLGGIAIDGTVPSGLATSVIAFDGGLSYLAIDPDDAGEPSYAVSSAKISDARSFRLGDEAMDLPSSGIVNAAVSASWATLADFGGNLSGLETWAPD